MWPDFLKEEFLLYLGRSKSKPDAVKIQCRAWA